MAVPSAVLKQRQELQAKLGLDANGQPIVAPPETPPETPPAVPPVEAAPPLPDTLTSPASDSLAAANARIAELEHLLKTRDGQTSTAMREANEAKSRAEATAGQVRALEEAVAELTKQKDTAQALATAKRADADIPSLEDVGDFTKEELETYGDSVGFVKKATKKELLAYIKPLLSKVAAMEQSLARLSDLDRLPSLEKSVQASVADSQRIREEEFFRKEVLAYFADFEKRREEPEWKDYLASDIPERGIKVGGLLHQYRLQHDAQGIRSVINAYYEKSKAKPNLSSLVVPQKTQTGSAPPTKLKLKASDYNSRLRDFISRRLPKGEWDAYKTEFEVALREGRVEMDARI